MNYVYSWLFSKLHIFQYRLRTNGGGPDDEALFIQKLTPTKVLLIQASNGERVAEIQSTDDSAFVAFCEHDCDNSTTRSSSGTSNLLFSGHDNGVIQMWDLQTAGVVFKKAMVKDKNQMPALMVMKWQNLLIVQEDYNYKVLLIQFPVQLLIVRYYTLHTKTT